MNRPALHIFGSRALVHRFSQQVKDAPQALVADGYRNRPTGIYSLCAAHKTVCCSHGNAACHIVANVLRHFHHQRFAVVLQFHSIQQGRQFSVGKANIQNGAGHLHDLPDVFVWHTTHSFVGS